MDEKDKTEGLHDMNSLYNPQGQSQRRNILFN